MQPSLTERVFRAAAWNTLLFPAKFVVGLVASVLLASLPPPQYGVLALLLGLAATIGLYSDLGIERSLPRFIPEIESRSGRRGVARFMARIIALKLAIVAVCLTVLLLLGNALIGYVIQNEQTTLQSVQADLTTLVAEGATQSEIAAAQQQRDDQQQIISLLQQNGYLFLWAVCALVVFGAVFDVFMQFLTAYFKQRSWNIITIVIALLQPLLIIGFIALGWELNGVLLGMVITPVVAVVLAAWQTHRAARELIDPPSGTPPDPTLTRRFAGFAGTSYFMQITGWFYDLQFIVFVLLALGVELREMALLAFGYKFAKDYLGYVYIPFSGVLTPLLARIKGREDQSALQMTYSSLTRIFALLLIPCGVGLALLTPALLGLLYPNYVNASMLILVFIAFTFVESLISVPHNVLMVYERYRSVLISRVLALVSVPLLALTVVFAPQHLLFGAAFAVGIARLLPRIYTLIVVRRAMGLNFPVAFIGRVVVATVAFAVPLLLLLSAMPHPASASTFGAKALGALGLAGIAALGGFGYLLALRLLGGLDEQERMRILSLKLPFKRVLARLL